MAEDKKQQDFLEDLDLDQENIDKKTEENQDGQEKKEDFQNKQKRILIYVMLMVFMVMVLNVVIMGTLAKNAAGLQDHKAAINSLIQNDKRIENNFEVLKNNAIETDKRLQKIENKISKMENEYKGKVQKFEEIKQILSE